MNAPLEPGNSLVTPAGACCSQGNATRFRAARGRRVRNPRRRRERRVQSARIDALTPGLACVSGPPECVECALKGLIGIEGVEAA